ncbi:MAG: hypothetical protein JRD89_18445 [Deltaproteobacteria bacterium]|nr:hypothetical protein [Deltaproteobacteria bacterium]
MPIEIFEAPQLLDYGGWTELPAISAETPTPVDGVIVGSAWGKNTVPTFEVNKTIDIKRKLMYGFYHDVNYCADWRDMARLWLANALDMGAQAIYLDYERSSRSDLEADPGGNANRAAAIIQWLQDRFAGDVGIYANFNDYVVSFAPYIHDHGDISYWVTWPDDKPDFNSADFDEWERKTGRTAGDYTFEQFTWKLYAPDYGVTNEKLGMDGNIYLGTHGELDEYLRLTVPEPPPPTQTDTQGCLNAIRNTILRI